MIITEDPHFGINAQSANCSDGRKYNLKISAIFDHGRKEFAAFWGALASIKNSKTKNSLISQGVFVVGSVGVEPMTSTMSKPPFINKNYI
ncbi:MAG: hypothetical protein IKW00_06050 [Clostridia bacterium]|nr:hypothetical protein [Clostridia bacterium]